MRQLSQGVASTDPFPENPSSSRAKDEVRIVILAPSARDVEARKMLANRQKEHFPIRQVVRPVLVDRCSSQPKQAAVASTSSSTASDEYMLQYTKQLGTLAERLDKVASMQQELIQTQQQTYTAQERERQQREAEERVTRYLKSVASKTQLNAPKTSHLYHRADAEQHDIHKEHDRIYDAHTASISHREDAAVEPLPQRPQEFVRHKHVTRLILPSTGPAPLDAYLSSSTKTSAPDDYTSEDIVHAQQSSSSCAKYQEPLYLQDAREQLLCIESGISHIRDTLNLPSTAKYGYQPYQHVTPDATSLSDMFDPDRVSRLVDATMKEKLLEMQFASTLSHGSDTAELASKPAATVKTKNMGGSKGNRTQPAPTKASQLRTNRPAPTTKTASKPAPTAPLPSRPAKSASQSKSAKPMAVDDIPMSTKTSLLKTSNPFILNPVKSQRQAQSMYSSAAMYNTQSGVIGGYVRKRDGESTSPRTSGHIAPSSATSVVARSAIIRERLESEDASESQPMAVPHTLVDPHEFLRQLREQHVVRESVTVATQVTPERIPEAPRAMDTLSSGPSRATLTTTATSPVHFETTDESTSVRAPDAADAPVVSTSSSSSSNEHIAVDDDEVPGSRVHFNVIDQDIIEEQEFIPIHVRSQSHSQQARPHPARPAAVPVQYHQPETSQQQPVSDQEFEAYEASVARWIQDELVARIYRDFRAHPDRLSQQQRPGTQQHSLLAQQSDARVFQPGRQMEMELQGQDVPQHVIEREIEDALAEFAADNIRRRQLEREQAERRRAAELASKQAAERIQADSMVQQALREVEVNISVSTPTSTPRASPQPRLPSPSLSEELDENTKSILDESPLVTPQPTPPGSPRLSRDAVTLIKTPLASPSQSVVQPLSDTRKLESVPTPPSSPKPVVESVRPPTTKRDQATEAKTPVKLVETGAGSPLVRVEDAALSAIAFDHSEASTVGEVPSFPLSSSAESMTPSQSPPHPSVVEIAIQTEVVQPVVAVKTSPVVLESSETSLGEFKSVSSTWSSVSADNQSEGELVLSSEGEWFPPANRNRNRTSKLQELQHRINLLPKYPTKSPQSASQPRRAQRRPVEFHVDDTDVSSASELLPSVGEDNDESLGQLPRTSRTRRQPLAPFRSPGQTNFAQFASAQTSSELSQSTLVKQEGDEVDVSSAASVTELSSGELQRPRFSVGDSPGEVKGNDRDRRNYRIAQEPQTSRARRSIMHQLTANAKVYRPSPLSSGELVESIGSSFE